MRKLWMTFGLIASWSVAHFAAVHAYRYMCVPLTPIGLVMSPLLLNTPHCAALRWLIHNGAFNVTACWATIAGAGRAHFGPHEINTTQSLLQTNSSGTSRTLEEALSTCKTYHFWRRGRVGSFGDDVRESSHIYLACCTGMSARLFLTFADAEDIDADTFRAANTV